MWFRKISAQHGKSKTAKVSGKILRLWSSFKKLLPLGHGFFCRGLVIHNLIADSKFASLKIGNELIHWIDLILQSMVSGKIKIGKFELLVKSGWKIEVWIGLNSQALFLDVFPQQSLTQSWRKLEFFEKILEFFAKFLEFCVKYVEFLWEFLEFIKKWKVIFKIPWV